MPHVTVVVRCRPPLPSEHSSTSTKVETNEVSNTVTISASSTKNEAKSFAFDRVLPEASTQEEVFEFLSPMVDHALDGLHATIFAYGQTGSGKTYTMEGYEYVPDSHGRPRPRLDTPTRNHGLLPRTIMAVFDRARQRMASNPNVQYRIKCSFMQLYNERVSDLLNPSTRTLKEGLKLRWMRNDQFQVENLYIFECETAEQMREMFLMGIKEKVMGSHHMNVQSSRSHCIFTIHVHGWDPAAPDCIVKSELSLVDLAGSEKLALLSPNPSAQLVKESIEINTSLLSLGKVITALAVGGTKGTTHVPYRDSKLTKLLKHSLGGNSMTAMIACISTVDQYVEESLSTLLYAGRARNITTVPKVNEDPRAALIRQLREEIASLKTELEYYKQLVANENIDISAKFLAKRRPDASSPKGNAGGSSSLTVQGNTDSSASGGETESELAEKLLQSCGMLKNVMAVNAQLRSAFDALKTARDESAQRELTLNAENLALRERIEMLESITLNNDDGSEPSQSSASVASSSVKKRGGDANHLSSSVSSGNLRSSQQQQMNDRKVSNSPKRLASSFHGTPQQLHQHDEPTHSNNNNRRAEPNARSTTRPQLDLTYGSQASSSATTATKLQDYQAKYRNPSKPTNYEDYYGPARKAMAPQSETAKQKMDLLDRLVQNLPKSTQKLVPSSMQDKQTFGTLAFAGTEDEVQQLEERRRVRMQKLQLLQEQQQALVKGFTGGMAGAQISTSALLGGAPDPPMVHAPNSRSGLSGTPRTGTSGGGASGRLFAYLSQEEASSMFTPEQQERLRQRQASQQQQSATTGPVSASGNMMSHSGLALPSTPGHESGRRVVGGQLASHHTDSLTQLQRQLEMIESSRRR